MKQTLTPNIYIRFKPNSKDVVEFGDSNSITINAVDKKSYTFDHVFQPTSSTREVFEVCCKSHVKDAINHPHKNTLVFVYGNTGTGKTYTIGLLQKLNQTSEGLIPLSLKHIFAANSQVSLTFYEIYNEEVFDLLNNGSKPLQIRQSHKEPYLQGLLEISVSNFLEAVQLINIGRDQRKVAEQKLNRNSSRSHAVLTIFIHHNDGNTSKICFVDLAGSERLKESESKGVNMAQAVHINSSLSSLQTVLVGLANNCQPSFRASKLTRLLQPYFNSSINMIVTSNGSNMQNIQFARRCKNIKIHQNYDDLETLSKIKYLEEQLFKARKSLKRDSLLTPRKDKSCNKQNKQTSCRMKSDHNLNHNRSHNFEQKNQSKGLLKVIAKLLTVIESSCKVLENISNCSHYTNHAYNFIKSLQIQDLDIKKFMNQRLNFLRQDTSCTKIKIKPKEIFQSINDLQKTNKRINQIGVGIVQIENKILFSKNYIQEICTRQLKCYLLQKKGRHNEEVISFLLSKIDKKSMNDVQEELKRMGVMIEKSHKRSSYIRIQEQF